MSRLTLALLWCAALAVAAGLLVAVGMRTRDPDSTLYAKLASDLASQPPSRWIAPEWGGAWDQHGLFREHPKRFGFRPRRFRHGAVLFGIAPFVIGFLPKILSLFATLLGRDTVQLRRRLVVRHVDLAVLLRTSIRGENRA